MLRTPKLKIFDNSSMAKSKDPDLSKIYIWIFFLFSDYIGLYRFLSKNLWGKFLIELFRIWPILTLFCIGFLFR